MKKVILLCVLVLTYYLGAAQSFTVSNYTANIVHPNPSQIVSAIATINNISFSAKDVMVERTVDILAPGHSSYFCWAGVCHSATTVLSDSFATIAPGDSNNSFYVDLNPNFVTGQDTSCYKFFDMNNASDFVEICFYFDITTGITVVNASQKNPLSVASPNPANTLSGINYYTDITKDPRLAVYNLLGEKVFETKLMQKQGAYIINVQDFKAGIYVYSLIENGKTVTTQKLVVAR